MAERSGFYNAKLIDGSYDRVYQAEDFATCLSSFIPTGIYVGQGNINLETDIDKNSVPDLEPTVSGNNLMISTGKAFINGYWYILDEENLLINLEYGTTKAIVLVLTIAEREIKIELLDLVNGEISYPKNDARYGILIGKVSYTDEGVAVEDLREQFIVASPKALQAIANTTLQKVKEVEGKINVIIDEGLTKSINVKQSQFKKIQTQALGTYYEAELVVNESMGIIFNAAIAGKGNVASYMSMKQTALTDLKNQSGQAFSWNRSDGGILKVQITQVSYSTLTSVGYMTIFGQII